MGLQKIEHDWATECTHTHTHTDSMPPMSALECGFSALELTEVMDNRDFQKIIYLGC